MISLEALSVLNKVNQTEKTTILAIEQLCLNEIQILCHDLGHPPPPSLLHPEPPVLCLAGCCVKSYAAPFLAHIHLCVWVSIPPLNMAPPDFTGLLSPFWGGSPRSPSLRESVLGASLPPPPPQLRPCCPRSAPHVLHSSYLCFVAFFTALPLNLSSLRP